MKKTFKRLIAIVMATTTMAVGMGSMNASAITYKGTTNKTTDIAFFLQSKEFYLKHANRS